MGGCQEAGEAREEEYGSFEGRRQGSSASLGQPTLSKAERHQEDVKNLFRVLLELVSL